MVTLAGMFSEMQTWFSIGKYLLDKADRSSINTKNNTKFKQLVKQRNKQEKFSLKNSL